MRLIPHSLRRRSAGYRPAVLAVLLALAVAPVPVVAACIGVIGEAAVSACSAELETNPRNLEARLALATALHKLGRKQEALKVIDVGLALFRGDATSSSTLEEKRWIIQQQGTERGGSDTANRLNIIKCKTLKGSAALKACDDGLASDPGNGELLTGRGDALLDLSPPKITEAINAYRKALGASPGDETLRKKLASAETLRQASVAACTKGGGSKALSACDRALLKGASDEARIQARRGDLLLDMGREKSALSAYRAASRLDPGNTAVQRAIAQLTRAKPEPPPPPAAKPAPERDPVPPTVARIFSNAPVAEGITY